MGEKKTGLTLMNSFLTQIKAFYCTEALTEVTLSEHTAVLCSTAFRVILSNVKKFKKHFLLIDFRNF